MKPAPIQSANLLGALVAIVAVAIEDAPTLIAPVILAPVDPAAVAKAETTIQKRPWIKRVILAKNLNIRCRANNNEKDLLYGFIEYYID